MVRICCVPRCKTRSSRDGPISFHMFPRDEHRRKIWLKSLKMTEVSRGARVCAKHFKDTDFPVGSNVKLLNSKAVPFLESEKPSPLLNAKLETVSRTLSDDTCNNSEDWKAENAFLRSQLNEKEEIIIDLNKQIEALQKELLFLRNVKGETIKHCIKCTVGLPFLTFDKLKAKKNKTIFYYTGFESFSAMDNVYNFLLPSNKSSDSNNSWTFESITDSKNLNIALCPKQQFLLTLIRLRRGFNIRVLADIFHISTASAEQIFLGWVNVMYIKLGKLICWPHRDILIENTPKAVTEQHPNMVGCIACTEFCVEKPSLVVKQNQCYSNYKGATTMKSLVMTDNNGAIIYVSPLFTGSVTGKQILVKSGFANELKTKLDNNEILLDDVILADKGCNVSSLVQCRNISINIPTFRLDVQEFTVDEAECIRKFSQEGVHVEKALGRLKKFYIFSRKIPISLSGSIEEIHSVCCILTMFRNRLR